MTVDDDNRRGAGVDADAGAASAEADAELVTALQAGLARVRQRIDQVAPQPTVTQPPFACCL